MSEQEETKNEGRHPHHNDDGDTKENKAKELLAEVAKRVKGTNDIVQETYITKLVQKEVEQRVDLLDKAMQKRFSCLTELNKVNRPDVETFDADGKLASGTYTKERLKAIKDAKAFGAVSGMRKILGIGSPAAIRISSTTLKRRG